MNTLLTQTKTQQLLQAAVAAKPHAIILAGPEGSGKFTLATELLAQLLGLKDKNALMRHPFYLHITTDTSSIGIEQIRAMQHFLSLKTTGAGSYRRAVLIQDAPRMPDEAQNALLKSLEEPPHDTIIVLTAASILGLLPTIRSRAQIIDVLPTSQKEALDYFIRNGFSKDSIVKAYIISNGQPGLMHALLHDLDSHTLVEQINIAKRLLRMPPYERLSSLEELAKNKDHLPVLLQSLNLVCKAAITYATPTQTAKLIKALRTIEEVKDAAGHNANSKLLLTHLLLQL